jgi:hypothetical protein
MLNWPQPLPQGVLRLSSKLSLSHFYAPPPTRLGGRRANQLLGSCFVSFPHLAGLNKMEDLEMVCCKALPRRFLNRKLSLQRGQRCSKAQIVKRAGLGGSDPGNDVAATSWGSKRSRQAWGAHPCGTACLKLLKWHRDWREGLQRIWPTCTTIAEAAWISLC